MEGLVNMAYLGIEKTMEHESDGDTNFNYYSWYSQQRIGTRTGNKGSNGHHPNCYIIKIGQNTEKNPERLKKFWCHSKSCEKLSANAGVKNSKRSDQ